jgi:undecaprenyl-diphosphatase
VEAVRGLDLSTLHWFQGHRTEWLDSIMVQITVLGGHVILPLVVLFSVGMLLALRRYQTAGLVVLVVVSGSVMVEVLKLAVDRQRPPVLLQPHLVPLPDTPSFPSGHSALSAVIYLTLALLVSGRVQGRRVHAFLIGASLFLTLLIGVSRMYLGVHYLSDVVAGWIAGLSWALLWRWIETSWIRFRERPVDVGGEDAPAATA